MTFPDWESYEYDIVKRRLYDMVWMMNWLREKGMRFNFPDFATEDLENGLSFAVPGIDVQSPTISFDSETDKWYFTMEG